MRAIIKCITTIDLSTFCIEQSSKPEANSPPDPKPCHPLENLFCDNNWWPELSQDHKEIIKHKDEIISIVSPDDQDMVKETFLCIIYDEATRTWVLVNHPTTKGITFRLKNDDSDKLKRACERLVTDLQNCNQQEKSNKKNEVAIKFDFISRIEVREPTRPDHTYSGEIIPAQRWKLAIKQKNTELYLSIISGFVAIGLILLSLPIGHVILATNALPIETHVPFIQDLNFLKDHPDWCEFFKGLIERLGTSAVVTATISLLSIILFYLDIRQKPMVRWSISVSQNP